MGAVESTVATLYFKYKIFKKFVIVINFVPTFKILYFKILLIEICSHNFTILAPPLLEVNNECKIMQNYLLLSGF